MVQYNAINFRQPPWKVVLTNVSVSYVKYFMPFKA